MKTKISGADLPLALLLLVVSGASIWGARDLPVGTFTRMGPGFVPVALAGALGLLAICILVQAFISQQRTVTYVPKPILIILCSLGFMAFMLERIGLVPCVFVVAVAASMAQEKVAWRSVITLAAFLAVFCYVLFIWALGLPIPAFF